MEDLQAAIEALQRARESKLAELRAIEQALESLGAPIQGRTATKDFEDLGIIAATKRYLKEQGAPRTTREIADALAERGAKSRSKNPIATVYATLHNSTAFMRTEDGAWMLAEPVA
jgi:HB1, ASXL, restriction endonuclease HTH domain